MNPVDIVVFLIAVAGFLLGIRALILTSAPYKPPFDPPARPAPPMPTVKAPKDASIYDCFDTGTKLVTALADRFGIPSEQLLKGSHLETGTDQNGKPSDVLQAVFVVALSPEDVLEAGRTLNGKADQNAE